MTLPGHSPFRALSRGGPAGGASPRERPCRPGSVPGLSCPLPLDDLNARVDWYAHWLSGLPDPDREPWVREQVLRAEAHALAGSALRHRLDPMLFEPSLPMTVRCRLWAVWLASVAPGPIVLDLEAREARWAQAEALVEGVLRQEADARRAAEADATPAWMDPHQ